MYDALSDVEIERQDVELLPARTVLSLVCHAGCGNSSTTSTSGTSSTPSAASTAVTPSATPTAAATTTAAPSTGPTFTANNIFLFLATNQYNTVTGGAPGTTAASGTGAAGTTGAAATSAS
jgi:hypothetical protein